ncbi:retrovirus-related pol polyprotein from transposon TNT 1-94 [Tanacetum coccineum]
MLEKKVNTTPVDYAVLNQLSQDFEKRFIPQTELFAEQAFWSQNSVNYAEPTLSSRPTNVEVPKELSKVSMVNTSLKKLKHHLAGFDVTYKQLYDSIKLARIRSKEQCDDLINQVNLKSVEISDLNASLQEKVLEITALKDDLRKLKGKALVNNAVTTHTIDPEMLKIDVKPIWYKDRTTNVSTGKYVQWKSESRDTLTPNTNVVLKQLQKVDACPNACEMWKAIERLKQGESINVQDLETNLYWEFGKFTSRDGESLESYYSRFYKMMNELVRNQCHVTNHQVNVQFLLQLQPEWQRSQQSTRNRGKAIVTSSAPTYDPEPATVTEDDEMSKEKEIDKLMALISLSFKKIYKPTNNNLRTSSNTSRANQDNSPRINRGTGYDNQRAVNVIGARENVGTPVVQKSGIQCCGKLEGGLNNDTDDESEDQELEAHYMYMAQIQEVTPNPVDNSGPIFDDEPMHKVQNNNDNYNVFAIENEHPERPESSNHIYLAEQGDTKITIDSLAICYNRDQDDQDDTDDLDQERDLLSSLIQKLKCEIDDNKNRNKFLESSNKALVDKLKGEIEDFKTKNKSLESSNNHFKEANNELSKVEIDCAKAKGDLIIPNTSVSRPQLKSNQLEDRVMSNNSQGKKQEVEDDRRNFKKCVLNNNHDLCVLHYIDGVNSRTRQPIAVPISTREPKHNVNQSVATSSKKTIATDSTVKKSRNITRKLYEQVSKTCSWCYSSSRTDKGMEFLNKTLHEYFAKEGIRHETSIARTPEQNGVVERRNRALVEAARTMLSAAKVPLFFWAEAIATTCFTQNRSLVIPRHEKTPYHIINARKPSVKFFHIFDSLCYIVKDGENLDKMKEKGDACIFVGTVLEQGSLSPDHQSQENVPQVVETVTTSNELELLYSPMFNELLNGTPLVVSKSSAVHAADAPDKRQQHNTTNTSTTTDVANEPPLIIQTTPQTTNQAPTQEPTVTATENIIQAETNNENAQVDDDEFINIFSTPVQERGETSSRHVDSSNMHTFYQHHPSRQRWTKDHPLEQVIGNPSQSIGTRRQLETDGKMCMFTLTVSRTEPKNIKEAMDDSAWIESM